MTNTQKNDTYRFFIVAFNAAPGVTYMNQVDQAYSAGMTTRQIVEVFTGKDQFLETYPSFLSADQFARRIIESVVKQAATDAAKSTAIAEVVAALGSGMSRGNVIFNIFNNIAAKSTTDKDWGRLVIQMNNQIAAADYYTSVLLRASTDLTELRSVVAGITDTTAATSLATITPSTSVLNESESNNGTISNSITFSVLGDTFVGANGVSLGTVSNVPAGLTASLTKQSATTAVLTLTGQATSALASNSISNLTVQFKTTDMASGLLPQGATVNTLSVSFRDLWPTVSSNTLSISQPLTGNLIVDLVSDTVTQAGKALTNVSGSLSDVLGVDLSGIPSLVAGETAVSVSFIGTAQDNTYIASPRGDRIVTGGGKDTVTLGAGADRVVFPRESVVSQVTINGFQAGATGDVLDFSSILINPLLFRDSSTGIPAIVDTNVTGIASYAFGGPPVSWSNGEILFALTSSAITASGVAGLFGTYYKAPTSAAKAILLTADVTGDAKIWAITNVSGAGVNSISESEVQLIGILKDINNFALSGLVAENFGIAGGG